MNQFIIVFSTMITILLLTKFLLIEERNNNQDVTLNFDSNKIKCKCNIDNPIVKENFSNYNKDFVVEKPAVNENIITSLENIDEPKHTNISAENFFKSKFNYPIEPLPINSYVIFPSNSYEYMGIGKDSDKINNI